jgi:hypothetical protein
MKRYVVPLLVVTTVLLAGTVLTCKNIVQSRGDCQLVSQSQWEVATIDTIVPGVKVNGTVYFKGNPQTGAVVFLTYGGGFDWEKETEQDGTYEFSAPFSGWYRIRACYQGLCSRGPDCETGEYEFYLGTSADSVHIDLCIGTGGPCPYYVCER